MQAKDSTLELIDVEINSCTFIFLGVYEYFAIFNSEMDLNPFGKFDFSFNKTSNPFPITKISFGNVFLDSFKNSFMEFNTLSK